jgi:hypothetical protein
MELQTALAGYWMNNHPLIFGNDLRDIIQVMDYLLF